MPSVFTADEAAAAEKWLARVAPQVLDRGQALVRSGSVVDWEWEGEGLGLNAAVHGGEHYELMIPYERGRFRQSRCSCPYELDCKHAAAAMLVALKQGGNGRKKNGTPVAEAASPAPVAPPDSLLSLVQSRVEKPITGTAHAALMTIENWWRAKKRTVPVNEFLRLAGLHDHWARDAVVLHAKDTPPLDGWDYLACVDAEMTKRGGRLPAPIPNLIDRARQAQLVEAIQREAAVKEWRSRVRDWAAAIPDTDTATLPALRLRLTDTGAVIEWCRPGQAEFVRATGIGLKNLPASAMPAAESLILSLAKDVWGTVKTDFHRGEENIADAIFQCLAFPQFRHVLVGQSGAPLTVHEQPLRWDLTEHGSGDYTLRLLDAENRVPPEALFVIQSTPAWFVTPEEAWRVAKWPFKRSEAGGPMLIPAVALESAEGVTVLRKLGLPLPPRFQQKVRSVPAKVTVQAKVHTPGEGRSSYVHARARADYEAFAPSEWWMEQGWGLRGRPTDYAAVKPKAGEILAFDKSALTQAALWFGALELKPATLGNHNDAWWERRITKDFPDQFLQWMSERPGGIDIELDAELASLRDGLVSGTVKLSVEEAGMDWFDLRVALDVADLTLSPEEIQMLLKAQGRWVRIEGKGWRKLHFALTPEQEAELAAMGLAVGDFDGSPQRLHALQLASGSSKTKSLLPADHAESVQRRAQEIQTRVQPDLPAAITAELRPYQLEGFHFLAYLSKNRFGGVLADDMGLGKTLQALSWIAWLREEDEASAPVLVVCPKSVQDNWRSEVARFCPGLRVTVWTRDVAGDSGLDGTTDVLVIHYQQLRQHEEKLSRQPWLAVILDEAQAIKNPNSQNARAACALRAEHRLALSGTPIENRLLDLWSIMAFAMPGVLGNRNHFAKHFDAKADPFARSRLSARVRPFLLRRTKKEVAKDLPDRIEEDLVCELEGPQQKLYQAELKRARAALLNVKTSKQLDKARFHILTSLLRLRQICCHPALVLKDAPPPADTASTKPRKRGRPPKSDSPDTEETGSAKLDALLELLETVMEEGNKVLVFSQFVEMLNLIRAQLEARQWPHYVLTGQTDDRGALVEQFQTCEGPAVFLISLKAGGFGLNLTAASYVVLCDPWWNPAVEAQAIDRTHRIGQTQKVNAYRLIVKDTIEEKIRQLQKHKSALAHDILGEENFASALTLDDFQFLLGEG